MTKAEMLEAYQRYHALVERAGHAEQDGHFLEATKLAKESWKCIDGMLRLHAKNGESGPANFDGIHIVIRYAPLLFDSSSLDELTELLKEQRRIVKSDGTLTARVSDARRRMEDAHRFWTKLEQCSVSEAGSTEWTGIAVIWERMGLVYRVRVGDWHEVHLVTHLEWPSTAKCPSCGAHVRAHKARLLEEQTCPRCHARGVFVLIPDKRPDTV